MKTLNELINKLSRQKFDAYMQDMRSLEPYSETTITAYIFEIDEKELKEKINEKFLSLKRNFYKERK